jgi:methionyl-tRNA formyltransferase
MQMDEGMDTGPVISCATTDIDPDETSAELSARLSEMGAELLRRDLPRWVRGELVATAQDDAHATMARMLEKRDGELDFTVSARGVHDRVRGMSPWPGAYTFLDEGASEVCKIWRTRVIDEEGRAGEPGCVVATGARGIEVSCGRGVVAIEELQREGKRRMDATAFLAGRPLAAGARMFAARAGQGGDGAGGSEASEAT